MTSVAKEESEICHIFTFPIIVANENFNLAGALKCVTYATGVHVFLVYGIQIVLGNSGLQIEGVFVYFTHIKCQICILKRVCFYISDMFLQKKKKIFVKMTHLVSFIHLIIQEYDSKCLKMYLITLTAFTICYKFLAPITKVNEGESNTPCPSTLEATYSSG
jgi:hypothetical protein